MPDFEILLPAPMMPMIAAALNHGAVVHKLWEADDKHAYLQQMGPKIRALAVGGGHQAIDGAFMAEFPNLEIIASFGVGYDHVDVAIARERGIIVTNTPDVLNEEVADTAMGLLLATVRHIPQADRHIRSGAWLNGAYPLTPTLRGRKLGIVGLGRIGKAIAWRAAAFGLSIAYHGRNRQAGVVYDFYPTLLGLAKACDILLVITPGGTGTYKMIDAAILEALGPDGIFINVARGSVVDEPALIAALQNRTILSAGLDVFRDEPRVPQALIDMDHVVLLPHIGSATHHTRDGMAQLVIDNLKAWQAGKPPLTPVPETPFQAL